MARTSLASISSRRPVAPESEVAARTIERILDAGERCIRRLGLARFAMADIAAHARVSRGSVYRYFPDRDALAQAVIARTAKRFVESSAPEVSRRRTLAAQVAEAAAFIRRHMRDEVLTLQLPGEQDTLLATLLTTRIDGLVESWVEFWQPYLADAEHRGEIRSGLDPREAAEWIVRVMLSFSVMPSVVVDLDDHDAVRTYVARYIVRGFAP